MKTPSVRRPKGFTLIELLVVITIIAVLAGAGFAAGNAAIQKAKKTTALASINAIESAINQFYSEYGTLPVANISTDTTTYNTKSDKDLLMALLGTETSNTPLNPRKIKFLSAKEGKAKGQSDGINGLVYSTTGSSIIGLFDPWGGPYYIKMDGDYDDVIAGVRTGSSDDTPVNVNGKKCAVWSNGADSPTSANGGKKSDDVKSWP